MCDRVVNILLIGMVLTVGMGDLVWATEAAIQIGRAEEARWTETTTKAAKTPEEAGVLATGRVATVTGELVDTSCYLQLDKRGPGHVACGASCIRHGQPAGLLTENRQLYILIPEEHDPRKGGAVSIREFLADHVGQIATATGMLVERDGYRTLFIAGAPLTPPSATTTQGS